MKRYLVKFNRPLLIKFIDNRGERYKPVYGFYGGRYTDDEEDYQEQRRDYILYSSYLAAIHEWSNTTSPEFTISDLNASWIDTAGQEHFADDWVDDICARAYEKLGLDITVYVIDKSESTSLSNRFIKSESYMNSLVRKAVSPEECLKERQVDVRNCPQENMKEG